METIPEDSTQNSDHENEMNFVNINRKTCRIIDSDSETETTKEADNSTIITNKTDSVVSDNSVHTEETPKSRVKRIAIIDSDSEDDDCTKTPISHNKSFTNQNHTPITHPEPTYTTNPKNELILENQESYKSKLTNLCDSESSDSDDNYGNNTKSNQPIKSRQRKSKKMEKTDDSKPKKLKSGKEAAEQRKEIAAESQRMLRESRVSLPYHVPKTHSLKEFLEKRSRLAAAVNLPEPLPPSVGIKMTKEQLEIVSKKFDERLKEVEEFYKSDSESDTENINKDIEETQIVIRDWLSILVDNAIDSVDNTDLNNDNVETNLDNVENNEINQPQVTKKLKKLDILKEKLANIQPKLSGNPDEIIDLETGTTRPSEIKKLVDKYIEHTIPKHLHKDKVQTSIVSVSGGDIHEETVTLRVDDDDKPVPIFEVPGAKLKKLKEKLINEMAEKRSELWQQKNTEIITEKSDDPENKDGYEDDYLDDDEEEEEYELTETSSDEEIEDDIQYSDKLETKQKCDFLDDEAEVEDDDDDGDDNNDEDEELEQNDKTEDNGGRPKKLKRVISGFNDDDSDTDVDITINDKLNFKHTTPEKFAIPPNIPKLNQSPADKTKTNLDFLTPVTFITGLQNLNAEQKLQESPVISPFKLPTQPSPLRGEKWQSNLQKQLFEKSPQSEEQQHQEELPTTQDLLEICSGDFPETQQQKQQQQTIVLNENKEIKELDQEDQVISQLLDEDDLEEFQKKLNSNNDEINEIKPTGIIDSDDETDRLDLKQQKRKRAVISDESSDDDQDDDDDEIDLHDITGLDEEIDESKNIDYDSEENEIVEEQKESKKFTVNDFVENEAELSESEWDSDDEDEKDLDQMEFEQGDKEEFDEAQIRNDIEKVHMRRLLDDDTREIKLLQELLLEDGELHGSGRQRQFRWRNIDSVDDGDGDNKEGDDGVYLDDEENEEEWRKMRHKREMFLKQNSHDDDDVDSILQNSEILKIGQKSIRISQSLNNSQNSSKTIEATEEIIKEPFKLSSKRGSFLSRNDQVLQRLAEYTKVSTNIVGTTKNSKSFLFQSVTVLNKETKRKATEETPKALKKIRLTNFSPSVDRDKAGSSKKLF